MMNSNFNRLQLQEHLESYLGCNDASKWGSYSGKLLQHHFNDHELNEIRLKAYSDACSFFAKGMHSLCEALWGIEKKKYSWSVVKLYYSTYYLTRSFLYSKGYPLVRCSSFHLIELSKNVDQFVKIKGCERTLFDKKYSLKASNDHEVTFLLLIDKFSSTDLLLGNPVDDEVSYYWLKRLRERVNYVEANFSEPNCPDFFADYISESDKNSLLESYLSDSVAIFQNEHAAVAIPFMRASLTAVSLAELDFANVNHFPCLAINDFVKQYPVIGQLVPENLKGTLC